MRTVSDFCSYICLNPLPSAVVIREHRQLCRSPCAPCAHPHPLPPAPHSTSCKAMVGPRAFLPPLASHLHMGLMAPFLPDRIPVSWKQATIHDKCSTNPSLPNKLPGNKQYFIICIITQAGRCLQKLCTSRKNDCKER